MDKEKPEVKKFDFTNIEPDENGVRHNNGFQLRHVDILDARAFVGGARAFHTAKPRVKRYLTPVISSVSLSPDCKVTCSGSFEDEGRK